MSARRPTSRMVRVISSSVSESRDDVASSKTRSLGSAQESAGDGESLFLASGDFDSALADEGVEAVAGAGEQ